MINLMLTQYGIDKAMSSVLPARQSFCVSEKLSLSAS